MQRTPRTLALINEGVTVQVDLENMEQRVIKQEAPGPIRGVRRTEKGTMSDPTFHCFLQPCYHCLSFAVLASDSSSCGFKASAPRPVAHAIKIGASMNVLTWCQDCHGLCRLILHYGKRSQVSEIMVLYVAPFLQPPRRLCDFIPGLTMVTTCGNLDSCRLVEEESNKYFDIQFRGEGIGAIASKANGLIAEVAPGPMRTCYAHDREEYNCRQCDQRQDGRFTAYSLKHLAESRCSSTSSW